MVERRTAFETERGISSVEESHHHALVVVTGVPEADLNRVRLEALRAISELGISIDFLKHSLDGFSFLVTEAAGGSVRNALCAKGLKTDLYENRSVLSVHAVNLRDESGLVARIAQTVVQSGASIESVGDMHSSVFLVVDGNAAPAAAAALRELSAKKDEG